MAIPRKSSHGISWGYNSEHSTNEINKIIDNKLKPLEAKQNNFMQMIHNLLHNYSNGGNRPCYTGVIDSEVNEGSLACVKHQQQQPFVVQSACGNEIYGYKGVDVGSIVKEKVLETVLRERISKESAMRESELKKMLQREKELQEKEESIRKDKDKRILELESKEKILEMQQNEMKKKLEGYETKNDVSRCAYSNMIVQPENGKKAEGTIDNSDNAYSDYDNESKKKKKAKQLSTKRDKQLDAGNCIEYNEEVSDEWNNVDFSKYLNQKAKHNINADNSARKKKRKNNLKKIRLEKSEYPKMWLGRRVDNSILDN